MRVEGACDHRRCGSACCRLLGVPSVGARVNRERGTVSVPVAGQPQRWIDFLRARGADVREDWATVAYRQDVREPVVPIAYGPRRTEMLLIKSVCPQLAPDGDCRLHGTPEKPETCTTYPTIFDDLSVVPECSYRIVEE